MQAFAGNFQNEMKNGLAPKDQKKEEQPQPNSGQQKQPNGGTQKPENGGK